MQNGCRRGPVQHRMEYCTPVPLNYSRNMHRQVRLCFTGPNGTHIPAVPKEDWWLRCTPSWIHGSFQPLSESETKHRETTRVPLSERMLQHWLQRQGFDRASPSFRGGLLSSLKLRQGMPTPGDPGMMSLPGHCDVLCRTSTRYHHTPLHLSIHSCHSMHFCSTVNAFYALQAATLAQRDTFKGTHLYKPFWLSPTEADLGEMAPMANTEIVPPIKTPEAHPVDSTHMTFET